MSNHIVVSSSGEPDSSVEATSSYAARLAFQHFTQAFQLAGYTMTVEQIERPGRLWTKLTARASGANADGSRAEVLLYQRGIEQLPTPGAFPRLSTDDPAVAAASNFLAFVSVAVGQRRLALVGGIGVIDPLNLMILPESIKDATPADIEDARRDDGGYARQQLHILRLVGGATGDVSEELLDELEKQFGATLTISPESVSDATPADIEDARRGLLLYVTERLQRGATPANARRNPEELLDELEEEDADAEALYRLLGLQLTDLADAWNELHRNPQRLTDQAWTSRTEGLFATLAQGTALLEAAAASDLAGMGAASASLAIEVRRLCQTMARHLDEENLEAVFAMRADVEDLLELISDALAANSA